MGLSVSTSSSISPVYPHLNLPVCVPTGGTHVGLFQLNSSISPRLIPDYALPKPHFIRHKYYSPANRYLTLTLTPTFSLILIYLTLLYVSYLSYLHSPYLTKFMSTLCIVLINLTLLYVSYLSYLHSPYLIKFMSTLCIVLTFLYVSHLSYPPVLRRSGGVGAREGGSRGHPAALTGGPHTHSPAPHPGRSLTHPGNPAALTGGPHTHSLTSPSPWPLPHSPR